MQENYADAFWERQRKIIFTSYINTILIVINVLIFAYGFFSRIDVYDSFALESDQIAVGGGYIGIISSMFLHASPEHLFSNMLVLFFVGANVEHDIGHAAYLVMYMFSGIVGNIVSVYYDIWNGEFTSSIGASGAVFGVIGAVVVIVICGRKHLRAGSTLIFRLGLMVFFSVYSGFADSEINNAAHIGGLLGGVLITLLITLIWRKEYTMEEWL